jgi:hypothetical protein
MMDGALMSDNNPKSETWKRFKTEYLDRLVNEWNSRITDGLVLDYKDLNLNSFVSFLSSMAHYSGIEYGKIRNFNFEWQHPGSIEHSFWVYEKEYKELQKDRIRYRLLDTNAEIILNMGEYKWVDLKRSYCELEAQDMHHCGNAGGSSDDTILSLRHFKSGTSRSLLTFILDTVTGDLGEMKGSGNTKPEAKYHPHIMKLLLNYRQITEIRGGGYAPARNFSTLDLSDENFIELIQKRPEIVLFNEKFVKGLGSSEIFDNYVKEVFLSLLNDVRDIILEPESGIIKVVYPSSFKSDNFDLEEIFPSTYKAGIKKLIEDNKLETYPSYKILALLQDEYMLDDNHILYQDILLNDNLNSTIRDMARNPLKYVADNSDNIEQKVTHHTSNAGSRLRRRMCKMVWERVSVATKCDLLNSFFTDVTTILYSDSNFKSLQFSPNSTIIGLDLVYVTNIIKGNLLKRSGNIAQKFNNYFDIQEKWYDLWYSISTHVPPLEPLKAEVDKICNQLVDDKYELEDALIVEFY